jgi:hypothetical protein
MIKSHIINKVFGSLLFFGIFCVSAALSAETPNNRQNSSQKPAKPSAQDSVKIERIGGEFEVTNIESIKDNYFRVTFVSTGENPRFKTLVLESSHVHVRVQKGSILRLSADVEATSGTTARVDQVVLFFPGRVGKTPVWMVSRQGSRFNSPPGKLIEMHAPSTDYQIF